MTLYESLERQDPQPAVAAERPQRQLLEIRGVSSLTEALGLMLVSLLLMTWALGAYAGIVYWSVQGSIWGVVLSAIVPGFGAATTLPLYLWLGSGGSL
ncbi:hypothetical protein [Rubellimicrobium roseum]|uniref:Uncharacterized protein n=1 Tax=Rubellimicrobium roseum TaxID=687525 RepID=A0A5C4NN59_9RHOB|nr:hypothetical protein [Rubellimicrobium roseum]TNC74888.1 hypothetical protein FHG71_01795 [Rubellimicrobium roseum]